ncbi:hypothetical protein L3Y21_gp051 [Gordonia phage Rabbitrun]|uniref:Uncharacterized protein n=1 Tax=Gordonia phage Rabbitrun TaxID=2762280 RepID=A0A7G8LIM2_9CAUD|nr:hypothetical protein L3Y21_gp051 [Gordonia phage Rabbitrun]QNJ57094.1 hypothetical protein SEA_RABBITRUN_51 [Gordonia phage Rabbitrun]
MYNYDHYYNMPPELREAKALVDAWDTIVASKTDLTTAKALVDNASNIQAWLDAEKRWQNNVRLWLQAEKRWEYSQTKMSKTSYAAAKRGWDEIKKYVPNFDGYSTFEQLPESLQFRYAAFAAAALEIEVPPEVKSGVQNQVVL